MPAWYFYYFFRMAPLFSNMNRHEQCNNILESGQSYFPKENIKIWTQVICISLTEIVSLRTAFKSHIYFITGIWKSNSVLWVTDTMTYSLRPYEHDLSSLQQ